MTVVLFILAAALGASLRAAICEASNSEHFPYGTFSVNIIASLAIGALSQASAQWSAVVGIGALGAFSTWSAVANEVAGMARSGQGALAALYLIAMCSSGILAAWIGLQLAG